MRVIKLGIISIIVFFLVFTVISLFFPSHIRISRAIDLNTTIDGSTLRERFLQQVETDSNWHNWWIEADSLKLKPEKEIITNGLKYEAEFRKRSGKMNIGLNLLIDRQTNSKTLQWYFDFHLRWYPWEKFSSLLLEKKYGPMM